MSPRVPRIIEVAASNVDLFVHLSDHQRFFVLIGHFPRLASATPEQRANWRLIGDGQGVHWPDVDEDISAAGLVHIHDRELGRLNDPQSLDDIRRALSYADSDLDRLLSKAHALSSKLAALRKAAVEPLWQPADAEIIQRHLAQVRQDIVRQHEATEDVDRVLSEDRDAEVDMVRLRRTEFDRMKIVANHAAMLIDTVDTLAKRAACSCWNRGTLVEVLRAAGKTEEADLIEKLLRDSRAQGARTP
jgi:hypothetical protein